MVRERPFGDPAQGTEADGVMKAGVGANDVAEAAAHEHELLGGTGVAAE